MNTTTNALWLLLLLLDVQTATGQQERNLMPGGPPMTSAPTMSMGGGGPMSSAPTMLMTDAPTMIMMTQRPTETPTTVTGAPTSMAHAPTNNPMTHAPTTTMIPMTHAPTRQAVTTLAPSTPTTTTPAPTDTSAPTRPAMTVAPSRPAVMTVAPTGAMTVAPTMVGSGGAMMTSAPTMGGGVSMTERPTKVMTVAPTMDTAAEMTGIMTFKPSKAMTDKPSKDVADPPTMFMQGKSDKPVVRMTLQPTRRKDAMKRRFAYRLCNTRQPTKCDRLLLRNTYNIYEQRRTNQIANDKPLNDNPISVKIYFHQAIRQGMAEIPLSKATIQEFISRLEIAFEGTRFDFTYVNQTIRVNSDWHACGQNKEWKIDTHVGGPKDCTILLLCLCTLQDGSHAFCCRLCDTRLNDKVYLGSATYPNVAERHPEEDGVTLLNPQLAGEDDWRIGGLPTIYWQFVHQVGHWLGLLHTYAGGCHQIKQDNPTDAAVGDGVDDTPPQRTHSLRTRGVKKCFRNQLRKRKKPMPDSCPVVDDEGDDVFNYMNLMRWQCWKRRGHFTKDQIIRMYAMFQEYRAFGRREEVENYTPLRD